MRRSPLKASTTRPLRSPFDLEGLAAKPASGPRSVLRVPRVLAILAAHPEGLSLAMISRRLALPKTSVFTLLGTLQQAHFVEHEHHLWRLGQAAVELGQAMGSSAQRKFPDCARPILEELAQRSGETVLLAQLSPDREQCLYVATVEPEHWLRFSVKVGSLKPAYATGSGRAMLAWLSDTELSDLLDRFSFDRITPLTVGSKRALRAGLNETRRRAVSTVDGGTVTGVMAVAAPIFDAQGAVVAAVSIGGPTERIRPVTASIEAAARDGGEQISRTLGYLGPWPAPRPAPTITTAQSSRRRASQA